MTSWERITNDGSEVTDRLNVPGGWLYRTVVGSGAGVALAFVADYTAATSTLAAHNRAAKE